MKYVNALFAEIRISLENTWSYKTNFISDVLFTGALYIAFLVMDVGSGLGGYYGVPGDSKSLLLTGFIFWSFSTMAINLVSSNIQAEAERGTLEQKLTSIIPLYILLIGKLLASILVEMLEITIILIISNLIFHVGVIISFKAIVILLITIAGMYGVGLIFGGLTLKFKVIDKIIFIFQTLLLFISDTFMIVSDKLSIINLIPLTKGNDIARKAVMGQIIPMKDYFTLCIVSLLWILIGVATFNYLKKQSKNDGLVGSY